MRSPRLFQFPPRRRQTAYSLAELTLVVVILGVLAVAVIPDSSPTVEHRLDLAAGEVARALRYARAESLRSGQYYGVTVSQETQKLTVKKWDVSADPVSTELVPYHPVSKKAFVVASGEMTLTRDIVISNTSDAFLFDSIGRRGSLIFDPRGMPIWSMSGGSVTHRLVDGIVELSDGTRQRQVKVAPLTGRVTVQ